MANMTSTSTSATDLESVDEVFTNENVPAVNTPSIDKQKAFSDPYKRLSTVSRMYDVDGDGKLNDAELAMRDMDQSGRGYLTNDKVYALMIEQLETQKQLFRVKRIMFVLLALVFILALANLGTSFAAASLSKDTTTSSSAALMDKKTNEAVSTQTTSDSLTIERAIITSDGRRKLCNVDGEANDAECDLSDRNSILSMNQRHCRRMLRLCDRGNTVSLTRTWKNGDKTSFSVCPYTGTLSTDNLSELTNIHGLDFTFEEIAGGHCKIGGDAVTQPQGRICEMPPDCAPGLTCVQVQEFVDNCQLRCGYKRWAPRMVKSCQDNCSHPSCLAAL